MSAAQRLEHYCKLIKQYKDWGFEVDREAHLNAWAATKEK